MIGSSGGKLVNGLNGDWLLAGALQQASGARDGEPGHDPVEWVAGDEEGGRGGDPDAQAKETIHKFAGEAVAELRADADDDVGRAVLGSQQVRDPPGGEDGEDEADGETEVVHVLLCRGR